MPDSWQRRIDRAVHLSETDPAAGPLLATYGKLLGLQRDCAETLRHSHLTGSVDRDLPALRPCIRPMLRGVVTLGSSSLAGEVRQLLDRGDSAIEPTLVAGWRERSGQAFFPKIALQPYAEQLAATRVRPVDRDLAERQGACPFCGGAPQLSILESGGDDGGGRQLLCAICLTRWPFRRVLCAHCGEEDEPRLGYFHSPAFPHLRVDACDTCKHYLKTVDLTRLGLAVPIVDEVAGGSLDLWATEHGYQKIELNLVGL